ncbi:hypothetical protein BV898_14733 [Hypsibius exemplaris]|uniref:Uncharacterized protein n=1 Tax=Hypsibius exemplaris TaxID=2072580 RepID=A0A9X6RJK9_HYPEX|nr:hypothetical protein BV898_14733 [Hypsibius exemplaris]
MLAYGAAGLWYKGRAGLGPRVPGDGRTNDPEHKADDKSCRSRTIPVLESAGWRSCLGSSDTLLGCCIEREGDEYVADLARNPLVLHCA